MRFMKNIYNVSFESLQRDLSRCGFKRKTKGKHLTYSHPLICGRSFPISRYSNGMASIESIRDSRRAISYLLELKE